MSGSNDNNRSLIEFRRTIGDSTSLRNRVDYQPHAIGEPFIDMYNKRMYIGDAGASGDNRGWPLNPEIASFSNYNPELTEKVRKALGLFYTYRNGHKYADNLYVRSRFTITGGYVTLDNVLKRIPDIECIVNRFPLDLEDGTLYDGIRIFEKAVSETQTVDDFSVIAESELNGTQNPYLVYDYVNDVMKSKSAEPLFKGLITDPVTNSEFRDITSNVLIYLYLDETEDLTYGITTDLTKSLDPNIIPVIFVKVLYYKYYENIDNYEDGGLLDFEFHTELHKDGEIYKAVGNVPFSGDITDRELSRIEHLDISGITNNIVDGIEYCTNMKFFKANNTKLKNLHEIITNFRYLRTMDLSDNEFLDLSLLDFTNSTNLLAIDLSNNTYKVETENRFGFLSTVFPYLSGDAYMFRLRSLKLANTGCKTTDIVSTGSLINGGFGLGREVFKNLRELDLSNNYGITGIYVVRLISLLNSPHKANVNITESLSESVSVTNNLRVLNLSNTMITNTQTGIETTDTIYFKYNLVKKFFESLENIRELNLYGCKNFFTNITYDELYPIALKNPIEFLFKVYSSNELYLKVLNVGECNLDEDFFSANFISMNSSKISKSLTTLKISENRVLSNISALLTIPTYQVSSINYAPNITSLNLANTNINDLSCIFNFKNLKRLNITNLPIIESSYYSTSGNISHSTGEFTSSDDPDAISLMRVLFSRYSQYWWMAGNLENKEITYYVDDVGETTFNLSTTDIFIQISESKSRVFIQQSNFNNGVDVSTLYVGGIFDLNISNEYFDSPKNLVYNTEFMNDNMIFALTAKNSKLMLDDFIKKNANPPRYIFDIEGSKEFLFKNDGVTDLDYWIDISSTLTYINLSDINFKSCHNFLGDTYKYISYMNLFSISAKPDAVLPFYYKKIKERIENYRKGINEYAIKSQFEGIILEKFKNNDISSVCKINKYIELPENGFSWHLKHIINDLENIFSSENSSEINEKIHLMMWKSAEITEIEIKDTFETDREVTDLNGIQYLTNLKKANLSNNNIENLNYLSCENWNDDYYFDNGIKDTMFRDLVYLDLSNNKIKDINNLKNCLKLEYLDLSFNDIRNTQSNKTKYEDFCLERLVHLDISGNKFFTNVFEVIYGTQHDSYINNPFKNLSYLNISFTGSKLKNIRVPFEKYLNFFDHQSTPENVRLTEFYAINACIPEKTFYNKLDEIKWKLLLNVTRLKIGNNEYSDKLPQTALNRNFFENYNFEDTYNDINIIDDLKYYRNLKYVYLDRLNIINDGGDIYTGYKPLLLNSNFNNLDSEFVWNLYNWYPYNNNPEPTEDDINFGTEYEDTGSGSIYTPKTDFVIMNLPTVKAPDNTYLIDTDISSKFYITLYTVTEPNILTMANSRKLHIPVPALYFYENTNTTNYKMVEASVTSAKYIPLINASKNLYGTIITYVNYKMHCLQDIGNAYSNRIVDYGRCYRFDIIKNGSNISFSSPVELTFSNNDAKMIKLSDVITNNALSFTTQTTDEYFEYLPATPKLTNFVSPFINAGADTSDPLANNENFSSNTWFSEARTPVVLNDPSLVFPDDLQWIFYKNVCVNHIETVEKTESNKKVYYMIFTQTEGRGKFIVAKAIINDSFEYEFQIKYIYNLDGINELGRKFTKTKFIKVDPSNSNKLIFYSMNMGPDEFNDEEINGYTINDSVKYRRLVMVDDYYPYSDLTGIRRFIYNISNNTFYESGPKSDYIQFPWVGATKHNIDTNRPGYMPVVPTYGQNSCGPKMSLKWMYLNTVTPSFLDISRIYLLNTVFQGKHGERIPDKYSYKSYVDTYLTNPNVYKDVNTEIGSYKPLLNNPMCNLFLMNELSDGVVNTLNKPLSLTDFYTLTNLKQKYENGVNIFENDINYDVNFIYIYEGIDSLSQQYWERYIWELLYTGYNNINDFFNSPIIFTNYWNLIASSQIFYTKDFKKLRDIKDWGHGQYIPNGMNHTLNNYGENRWYLIGYPANTSFGYGDILFSNSTGWTISAGVLGNRENLNAFDSNVVEILAFNYIDLTFEYDDYKLNRAPIQVSFHGSCNGRFTLSAYNYETNAYDYLADFTFLIVGELPTIVNIGSCHVNKSDGKVQIKFEAGTGNLILNQVVLKSVEIKPLKLFYHLSLENSIIPKNTKAFDIHNGYVYAPFRKKSKLGLVRIPVDYIETNYNEQFPMFMNRWSLLQNVDDYNSGTGIQATPTAINNGIKFTGYVPTELVGLNTGFMAQLPTYSGEVFGAHFNVSDFDNISCIGNNVFTSVISRCADPNSYANYKNTNRALNDYTYITGLKTALTVSTDFVNSALTSNFKKMYLRNYVGFLSQIVYKDYYFSPIGSPNTNYYSYTFKDNMSYEYIPNFVTGFKQQTIGNPVESGGFNGYAVSAKNIPNNYLNYSQLLKIRNDAKVYVYYDFTNQRDVVVPDVIGLPENVAIDKLSSAGINANIVYEDALILAENPSATEFPINTVFDKDYISNMGDYYPEISKVKINSTITIYKSRGVPVINDVDSVDLFIGNPVSYSGYETDCNLLHVYQNVLGTIPPNLIDVRCEWVETVSNDALGKLYVDGTKTGVYRRWMGRHKQFVDKECAKIGSSWDSAPTIVLKSGQILDDIHYIEFNNSDLCFIVGAGTSTNYIDFTPEDGVLIPTSLEDLVDVDPYITKYNPIVSPNVDYVHIEPFVVGSDATLSLFNKDVGFINSNIHSDLLKTYQYPDSIENIVDGWHTSGNVKITAYSPSISNSNSDNPVKNFLLFYNFGNLNATDYDTEFDGSDIMSPTTFKEKLCTLKAYFDQIGIDYDADHSDTFSEIHAIEDYNVARAMRAYIYKYVESLYTFFNITLDYSKIEFIKYDYISLNTVIFEEEIEVRYLNGDVLSSPVHLVLTVSDIEFYLDFGNYKYLGKGGSPYYGTEGSPIYSDGALVYQLSNFSKKYFKPAVEDFNDYENYENISTKLPISKDASGFIIGENNYYKYSDLPYNIIIPQYIKKYRTVYMDDPEYTDYYINTIDSNPENRYGREYILNPEIGESEFQVKYESLLGNQFYRNNYVRFIKFLTTELNNIKTLGETANVRDFAQYFNMYNYIPQIVGKNSFAYPGYEESEIKTCVTQIFRNLYLDSIRHATYELNNFNHNYENVDIESTDPDGPMNFYYYKLSMLGRTSLRGLKKLKIKNISIFNQYLIDNDDIKEILNDNEYLYYIDGVYETGSLESELSTSLTLLDVGRSSSIILDPYNINGNSGYDGICNYFDSTSYYDDSTQTFGINPITIKSLLETPLNDANDNIFEKCVNLKTIISDNIPVTSDIFVNPLDKDAGTYNGSSSIISTLRDLRNAVYSSNVDNFLMFNSDCSPKVFSNDIIDDIPDYLYDLESTSNNDIYENIICSLRHHYVTCYNRLNYKNELYKKIILNSCDIPEIYSNKLTNFTSFSNYYDTSLTDNGLKFLLHKLIQKELLLNASDLDNSDIYACLNYEDPSDINYSNILFTLYPYDINGNNYECNDNDVILTTLMSNPNEYMRYMDGKSIDGTTSALTGSKFYSEFNLPLFEILVEKVARKISKLHIQHNFTRITPYNNNMDDPNLESFYDRYTIEKCTKDSNYNVRTDETGNAYHNMIIEEGIPVTTNIMFYTSSYDNVETNFDLKLFDYKHVSEDNVYKTSPINTLAITTNPNFDSNPIDSYETFEKFMNSVNEYRFKGFGGMSRFINLGNFKLTGVWNKNIYYDLSGVSDKADYSEDVLSEDYYDNITPSDYQKHNNIIKGKLFYKRVRTSENEIPICDDLKYNLLKNIKENNDKTESVKMLSKMYNTVGDWFSLKNVPECNVFYQNRNVKWLFYEHYYNYGSITFKEFNNLTNLRTFNICIPESHYYCGDIELAHNYFKFETNPKLAGKPIYVHMELPHQADQTINDINRSALTTNWSIDADSKKNVLINSTDSDRYQKFSKSYKVSKDSITEFDTYNNENNPIEKTMETNLNKFNNYFMKPILKINPETNEKTLNYVKIYRTAGQYFFIDETTKNRVFFLNTQKPRLRNVDMFLDNGVNSSYADDGTPYYKHSAEFRNLFNTEYPQDLNLIISGVDVVTPTFKTKLEAPIIYDSGRDYNSYVHIVKSKHSEIFENIFEGGLSSIIPQLYDKIENFEKLIIGRICNPVAGNFSKNDVTSDEEFVTGFNVWDSTSFSNVKILSLSTSWFVDAGGTNNLVGSNLVEKYTYIEDSNQYYFTGYATPNSLAAFSKFKSAKSISLHQDLFLNISQNNYNNLDINSQSNLLGDSNKFITPFKKEGSFVKSVFINKPWYVSRMIHTFSEASELRFLNNLATGTAKTKDHIKVETWVNNKEYPSQNINFAFATSTSIKNYYENNTLEHLSLGGFKMNYDNAFSIVYPLTALTSLDMVKCQTYFIDPIIMKFTNNSGTITCHPSNLLKENEDVKIYLFKNGENVCIPVANNKQIDDDTLYSYDAVFDNLLILNKNDDNAISVKNYAYDKITSTNYGLFPTLISTESYYPKINNPYNQQLMIIPLINPILKFYSSGSNKYLIETDKDSPNYQYNLKYYNELSSRSAAYSGLLESNLTKEINKFKLSLTNSRSHNYLMSPASDLNFYGEISDINNPYITITGENRVIPNKTMIDENTISQSGLYVIPNLGYNDVKHIYYNNGESVLVGDSMEFSKRMCNYGYNLMYQPTLGKNEKYKLSNKYRRLDYYYQRYSDRNNGIFYKNTVSGQPEDVYYKNSCNWYGQDSDEEIWKYSFTIPYSFLTHAFINLNFNNTNTQLPTYINTYTADQNFKKAYAVRNTIFENYATNVDRLNYTPIGNSFVLMKLFMNRITGIGNYLKMY